MANLNYTAGNWTIMSREVDTISTPKSLSIPDLDYSHDYSVEKQDSSVVRILNTSGTALDPVEKIEYKRGTVDNMYRGTDAPIVNPNLALKRGRSWEAGHISVLEGVNSVTGETINPVVRGRVVLEFPQHAAITSDAVIWEMKRLFAAVFKTGLVDGKLVVDGLRGDLDPTK